MNAGHVTLVVLVAALGVGCQPKAEKVSLVGREARQAISQAATARYPGNAMTPRDFQAVAINYPAKNVLEIHNPGTTSIPACAVWVNGTFLTQIDGVAPKSFVEVRHSALLEAGPATNDLKASKQPVAKVEIQTNGGLFSVQGPTIKR